MLCHDREELLHDRDGDYDYDDEPFILAFNRYNSKGIKDEVAKFTVLVKFINLVFLIREFFKG